MSVLSKKLHVMKTGGADIAISLYTTTGECAEPNLKLLVDGTQAYAKLGSVSDSNATPLRVYRNSDKEAYAVLKTAVTVTPGNFVIKSGATVSFTVPAGVKVIAVLEEGYFICYVGVTPGKTYTLKNDPYGGVETESYGNTLIGGRNWVTTEYSKGEDEDFEGDSDFELTWSESINLKTPEVTDY